VHYYFCKCTVQNPETSGRVGKQVHNPVNEEGLQSTVMGQLPLEKFQNIVHTCGERMEAGWTAGSSANE
jgi:hypothetical protein